MFVVFAVIATVPLLAMSYLALAETRAALAAEVGGAHEDAAKAAAGFVAVYVENGRVLLESEARGPFLGGAVAAGDRGGGLLAIQGLRERAEYDNARIFENVVLLNASGDVLAASPPEAAERARDPLHAAAFAMARTRAEFVIVPSPREGPPVLPLAAPVLVNGTVQGVLVADLSLDALGEGLRPFAPASSQVIYLVDASGRLVLHPNATLLRDRPDLSAIAPVQAAERAASGSLEYDDPLTGERTLGSFAVVPGLQWIVVDAVPVEQAYAALTRLTAVLVVLSGILAGAILLATVALARRVVAPVGELTDAARALSAGNLSKRIQPRGRDEIAELGRTFNEMADRIGESLDGLRRSEARYRSLVESANDFIFTVQPDGELSFASPLMRRALGLPLGAAGRPAHALVHEGDQAAFRDAVAAVIERGEPQTWIPLRFLDGAGGTILALANFSPVFEGGPRPARVLAVAHDVTQERRQELIRDKAFQMARLVSEEAHLEPLAQRGLGLVLAVAGSERGAVYLGPAEAPRAIAAHGAAPAGALARLAEQAMRQGSPVREADAIALPLLEQGEPLGAVALAGSAVASEDIDVLSALTSQLAVGIRRSLFEARLKEHAAELETRVAQRTAELTQKSGEMESFLYSVSHDLKAPLISIQGYAQGLQEDYASALEGDGALYLDRIRKNATLMESLILDILELSRIGRMRERLEDVDMDALLADAAQRMSGRFADAGGSLVVQPGLPRVRGERNRLGQLFANLLDNGLKYRHPDRAPRVEVAATETPDEVVYHVRDNGRGIPARYHDQLFKIFQRVPSPGMDDPGGTGMGLAIVRRIVETHRGRVWVESDEGEGATFHVAFPKGGTVTLIPREGA